MKRKTYFIRPSGTEAWVQTPASTVAKLRRAGYKVNLDERDGVVFIEIEPS
jgi:hypothetical protein